jgi:DNA replication protein DnaC
MLNGLPFVCEICIVQAERDEQERQAASDAAQHAATHLSRLRASGLAEPRWPWHLDNLDTSGRSRALDAARRWVTGDLSGLLLTGGVGVGKSTIAAAALVARAHTSPIQWMDAHRLIRDLQAGFNSPERERAQRLLDGGKRAPALVVDDLDKVRPTEYAAEAIFSLIDSREAHRRPLLITTNLRPAELAAKWPAPFGEAIGSRHRGYCVTLELTGGDRRARPAQPAVRDELATKRRSAA